MFLKCLMCYILLLNIFICIDCTKNDKKIVYAAIYEVGGKITKYDDDNSIVKEGLPLVKGFFKNSINDSGFGYLEIETSPILDDYQQSYTAGLIESALTAELIYSHWFNTVKDFRDTMNKEVISKIDNFLFGNLKWVNKQIEQKSKNDSYWHHVHLAYNQIQGILDGYNEWGQTHNKQIDFIDILWLNFFFDIRDLYDAFGGDKNIGDGHCSVLIKLMPNNSDIFIGHNTWVSYQTMLRIMKRYKFHYRTMKDIQNAKIIPGVDMTFSSYPGTIGSLDDFYLISSGLAVTETTNEMFNKTLWLDSLNSPENIVFESIRSVVSNRLANSGKMWCDIVKLYNSGTYNNQWMIFDYRKFKPGRPPSVDAFWVIEQAPTLSVAKDLTQVLIEKGYWTSYNIPYFDEVYKVTDYNSMLKKYGNWFSHDNAPRAKIFQRDHHNVHDMESFMDLMRSNDYKNDIFSHCQCDPPYSASGAIAARSDLNLANGTYQFIGQSHRPSGATDAKITNSVLFQNLQFVAVSGPTTGTNGSLPVFRWDTSDFTETPRISQPNIWNFKPILVKFPPF